MSENQRADRSIPEPVPTDGRVPSRRSGPPLVALVPPPHAVRLQPSEQRKPAPSWQRGTVDKSERRSVGSSNPFIPSMTCRGLLLNSVAYFILTFFPTVCLNMNVFFCFITIFKSDQLPHNLYFYSVRCL